MAKERNSSSDRPPKSSEAEALDALNNRTRRRPDKSRQMIEATIEAKAKKRRTDEAPKSSHWRGST